MLAAIILAAGAGKRMKGACPKVMQTLAGRTMLSHVLASLQPLAPREVILVASPGNADLIEAEGRRIFPDLYLAIQKIPRGTGDAVRVAQAVIRDECPEAAQHIRLVLYGDAPLVRTDDLACLVDACQTGKASIAVTGFPTPGSQRTYGRIVPDEAGYPASIVESADASPTMETHAHLANAGPITFTSPDCAGLLDRLTDRNAKGEYYLTDLLGLAHKAGLRRALIEIGAEAALGANTRAELARAAAVMQRRLRARAMENGVTLVDPDSVFLSWDTCIGEDAMIEPHVWIGPGVTIGARATIRAFSHLEGAEIGEDASVGPFARLRPGAQIGTASRVGNFVEIKASVIADKVNINHLAYVGDAIVGAGANIGAGAITCNYDGTHKHRTEIGAGAFIGSNVSLVAPVRVGASAVVGAGSVITREVAAGSLALGRAKQIECEKKEHGKKEREKKEKDGS